MLFHKVKELCDQNGITITKLEKNLEFGNGAIHKWDISQPSVEKVKKVADYFNVGIDHMVNDNLSIPSKESIELALDYDSLTPKQKGLVRCYLSLIKSQEV